MRVTIISNGYGEDAVGAALAAALAASGLEVAALPLVGRGSAYAARGLAVFGPRQEMPSGGIVHLGDGALWRDLRAGFISMTVKQLLALRRLRRCAGATVAVGDWYALAVASSFGRLPLFYLQLLLSLRTAQPGRAPFRPLELALMRRARRVFLRDAETAAYLQARGLWQADYLGNPMLDAIAGDAPVGLAPPYLLLLPGSRASAYESLAIMLEVCLRLPPDFPTPVVAWTGLPLTPERYRPWQLRAFSDSCSQLDHPSGRVVTLAQGAFRTLLTGAALALSTSGTATQQVAGWGVPVVAFAMRQPPHTAAFAEAQRRLLQGALVVTEAEPDAIARALVRLRSDPERYRRLQAQGRQAMGSPGATGRIAQAILADLGGHRGDH